MNGTVRQAAPQDAEAIARLLSELGYPASTEQARRRLERLAADTASRVFVLDVEGDVVGFAMAHVLQPIEHDEPWCELMALIVTESHRRHGFGRHLLAAVEDEADAAGCGGIVLGTAGHRFDAHAFYARLGYEQSGHRFKKRLHG